MQQREPLLILLRDALSPSSEDEARVRANLQVSLAAAATAATAAAAATASTAGGASASSGAGAAGVGALSKGSALIKGSLLAKGSALVVAGGALVGGFFVARQGSVDSGPAVNPPALSASLSTSADPHAADANSPSPISRTEKGSLDDLLAVVPSEAVEEDSDEATVASDNKRALSAPPPNTNSQANDSLSLELDLLSKANRALRAGDAAGAMAAVTEHAKRFPSGKLSLERQGVQAMALCLGGSLEAGRKVGRMVMAQAPGSPLVGRIQKTCELYP